MLEIDGSVLEGGGQILRIALCLSALLKKPIRIKNIRANRSKPGLAAQHLKGVELLRDICRASLKGAELGSTEISFSPNVIKGGSYLADPKTAGSISLLLQVSLPVALFADSEIVLELRGGTNCEMAPQIDYMTEVFRPNFERFGATFDFDLVSRGYFPAGGGNCRISVRPVSHLKPINVADFGQVTKIFGWSYVAGVLPIKVAHEMAAGAKADLKISPVDIEVYKEDPVMARGNCSGIVLCCETSSGCTIGGSALGNRKEKSFDTGRKAAREILEATTVKSCVDSHAQDQMIVFMALARGKSVLRTNFPLTLHTETAIHVAELMTSAKFRVVQEGETCLIECDGIGFENQFQIKP